jgi:hypothetical protein
MGPGVQAGTGVNQPRRPSSAQLRSAQIGYCTSPVSGVPELQAVGCLIEGDVLVKEIYADGD